VKRNNATWVIVALFICAILGIAVGMFMTKGYMNQTADTHGMSAGRSGDPAPNLIQEQQDKKSARGLNTTGANPDSSVPPASR
jgi:hypothetical protein